MKNILLLLCCLPLQLFAQDFTGLWSGTLYNDSTKTELFYEIAISKQNGKYSAYSYTNFMVEKMKLTGVKRLMVTLVKDHIVLEDEKLIYNDYPFDPPKGVKQLCELSLSQDNGIAMLTGKFITSRTRQYGKPVTGTVTLRKKEVFTSSKLLPVLNDLDLSASLSFLPKNETLPPSPVVTAKVKEAPKPLTITDELANRKLEVVQTIYYTSDSLQFDLYDNGYVDGDTISVLVNGKVIIDHKGLTEKALTAIVHTEKNKDDSLKVVLFAENLGSVAPNSGLLIIYDGRQRHEINFTGDLKTNAAILLRRKK